MTAIDLSSDIGLVAAYLLTANLLLGLLLSMRYNPWTHWPHRRINYFKIHNWTGYLALAIAGLHPVVLLFSSTAGFRLFDILIPVASPKQPWINTLGAVALYLLALVVVTSYYRVEIGRRRWKLLHYTAYATAVLFYIHSIWTDPTLKGAPVDLLDGEKVGIEACALVVVVAAGLRVRHAIRRRVRSLPILEKAESAAA